MEVTPHELLEYETQDGKCPYKEWLRNLRDARGRAKILVRVDRLEEGNFGDCEPVGEGVSELKINFGPGYRVYFAKCEKTVVLLLCGGDKSTQARDIITARKYWKNFREANE